MPRLLVLFLLAGAAWSRSLPHYDLDSLVWQTPWAFPNRRRAVTLAGS